MLLQLEWCEPRVSIEPWCSGQMKRQTALGTLNDRNKQECSEEAEWLRRTKSNNSLNPTLASGSFIIKLGGFYYLVYCELASVGSIRALDVLPSPKTFNR
jgi:hypothetical protein